MDFGDIRSLLQRPATQENWDALCEAIAKWDPADKELTEVILPYGERILESWPDEMRQVPYMWRNALYSPLDLPQPWMIWTRALVQGEDRGDFTIQSAKTLVGCPHFRRLTRLSIDGRMSQTAFGLIAHAPYFGNIRHLSLRGGRLPEKIFTKLAQAPLFSRPLLSLDLGYSGIGAQGLAALADNGSLKQLKMLGIADTKLTSPDALQDVLTASQLPQLQVLDLSNMGLAPEPFEHLISGGLLAQLQELTLSLNPLEQDWLDEAITRDVFTNIGKLTLWNSGLDAESFKADALLEHMPRLRHANLGNNKLYSQSLARLLAPSHPELHTLNVRSNSLGKDPQHLSALPMFPSLTHLDLTSNHLKDAGLFELLKSPILSTLKHLNLRHNHLGDPGMEALLRSPQLHGLETLDLSVSRPGDGVIAELSKSSVLPNLTHLILHNSLLSGQARAQLTTRSGLHVT